MPLQFQNVTLPLGGVDQKSHRLLRSPGTLDRAINVRFAKLGDRVVAAKRLGYARIAVSSSESVGAFGADVVWSACAVTPSEELLLFGHRWAFGLASPAEALRGDDSIVLRGPVNRGNGRARFISQSRLSQQVDDDT